MESKESLRGRMKRLRDTLQVADVSGLSQRICERLKASRLLRGSSRVALYASIGNEVTTQGIFHHLQENQCLTYFPRVAPEGIEFVRVKTWADLEPGAWGIPEPRTGRLERIERLDAILVPGLAFDAAGVRLGFGQGYYDRALQDYGGRKIGLAYDFQILESVPSNSTDLVCDWVVTESRMIRGAVRKEQ